MRDDDNTLVNSILFVGVLISLALLFYFLKLRNDRVIEGLESKIKERENSEDNAELQAEKVKALLKDVKGQLNIDKNIYEYEDIVEDLKDLVNANIMSTILNSKNDLMNADLTKGKAMNNIKEINELGKFNNILDGVGGFLQKN